MRTTLRDWILSSFEIPDTMQAKSNSADQRQTHLKKLSAIAEVLPQQTITHEWPDNYTSKYGVCGNQSICVRVKLATSDSGKQRSDGKMYHDNRWLSSLARGLTEVWCLMNEKLWKPASLHFRLRLMNSGLWTSAATSKVNNHLRISFIISFSLRWWSVHKWYVSRTAKPLKVKSRIWKQQIKSVHFSLTSFLLSERREHIHFEIYWKEHKTTMGIQPGKTDYRPSNWLKWVFLQQSAIGNGLTAHIERYTMLLSIHNRTSMSWLDLTHNLIFLLHFWMGIRQQSINNEGNL
jgi:hypothetical protein